MPGTKGKGNGGNDAMDVDEDGNVDPSRVGGGGGLIRHWVPWRAGYKVLRTLMDELRAGLMAPLTQMESYWEPNSELLQKHLDSYLAG